MNHEDLIAVVDDDEHMGAWVPKVEGVGILFPDDWVRNTATGEELTARDLSFEELDASGLEREIED